ncbi:MAG: TonB-dependent receptor [Cytophagaceae bacterium]|jgi:hypothetical protein|nr:TonB-dependent receptor [Cytophagaceae bacterium]
MKKLIQSLLLWWGICVFGQQTQHIRGQVLDAQSGFPIEGVKVEILGLDSLNVLTDTAGYYLLKNVPIGRHTVRFFMDGYAEKISSNILVSSGKETMLDMRLEERVKVMKEVVVKGASDKDKTKSLNKMTTVSARQFSVEETGRYAGSLNDPSRMAANFAGVSGANDSRNDIVIRGNSPTGLLWRVDGLPIPNPNHFGASGTTGGPVSMLNYNLLANSDFMTGAFPAEYGNATSGVFDINMRSGNTNKREYLGQIGFNGFELGAEGPFKKGKRASYLINYRYSSLALMRKIGLNLGTGAAVPYYQDLSAKFNLPTSKAGTFSLFLIAGKSYIELLDSEADTTQRDGNLYNNDGYDTYFGSRMGVVGLNHQYYFNPTTSLKTGIAISGFDNTITQDSIDVTTYKIYDSYEGKRADNRITFTSQLNKKFSAKNTLQSGVFIHYLAYDYKEESFNAVTGNWRNLTDSKGGTILSEGFSQWRHKFNEKLSLNIGAHVQHLSLNNSLALEPRLGMRYKFSPKHSVSLGGGVHNQMQATSLYFYETRLADGSYVKTNKELSFTRSTHAVVGYDWNLAAEWRVKVEGYYQHLDNVPVEMTKSTFSTLNSGADFGNQNADSLVNEGKGYNYGAEITIEKFLNKGYYLLVTTSLFESKYQGSDEVWRNTAFNGNYVVNALIGKEFKLGNKSTFFVDGKCTFAGGKRYVPVNLDSSRAVGYAVYDYSRSFEKQLKDYFRPDIKFGWRQEGKKITQEWSVNLQNVTNTQNPFTERYSRNQRKLVTVNQLGFFPMVQYRILF